MSNFFRDQPDQYISPNLLKADDRYKPSSFFENLANEFALSPLGDFYEGITRPLFEADRTFDPYLPENIKGYERNAVDFKDVNSAAEMEYVKSIVDQKRAAREALHDTGSWGPGLLLGIADPVNLLPLPFLKGIGFVRGAVKGGAAIGGLTTVEELARQAGSYDVPLEESAMAIGGSTILGGLLSGAVGRWGYRGNIDLERIGNEIQNAIAADGRSGFAGDPQIQLVGTPIISERDGRRLMASYNRETNTIRYDDEYVRQKFEERAWQNPAVEGVDKLPNKAFPDIDAWRRFVVEHELAHSTRPIREGQTVAQYENEMNSIALQRMYQKRLSYRYYDLPLTPEDAARLPTGVYDSVGGTDWLRMTPFMRMGQIAQNLKDNFLAAARWELADNGTHIRGVEAGHVKPVGVTQKITQRWANLPGEVLFDLDNVWQKSLGAAPKEGMGRTGVNWSARLRSAGQRLTRDDGPNTRSWFLHDVAVRNIVGDADAFERVRGYKPSEFVEEGARILDEKFFKVFEREGSDVGIWGLSPKAAAAKAAKLDSKIELAEMRLDRILARYAEKVKLIEDLENKARTQYRNGLSSKQYALLEDLKEETKLTPHEDRVYDLHKDLQILRRERTALAQFIDAGMMPPNEVRYFPRFYRIDVVNNYREELRAILADWFRENPTTRIYDKKKGWITVLTDPMTLDARVEDALNNITREARQIGGDGIVDPERLGSGLRYLKSRGIDIPNSKLIGVKAADGTVVDFLETDLDMVLRHYGRKMGPQIEIARKFGDRLMEERRSQIVEHFNKKYIEPLLEKLEEASAKETKQIKKQISDLRGMREQFLKEHLDLRDKILNQFDIADPSALSTRIVEGLRNWTSLAYSGGFLLSSLPDVARPMMVHGWRNFSEMVGGGLTDFSNWRFASEEMREVTGVFLDYINASGVRRVVDQGELSGFGNRTMFERGLQSVQGPAYLANLLTPWTHFWKELSGMMTAHVIGKNVRALANGTITESGRKTLLDLGIDERAARKIAGMPIQQSGKAFFLNTTEWTDDELIRLVGMAIGKEVEKIIVMPGVADKPNIMSGVFRVSNPRAQALINTRIAKTFGFNIVNDRVQNPYFSLPFQFLAWPIAATTKVGIAALQQRNAAAFYGAMSMIAMGWMSAWTKDPRWLDRDPGEQAIRAVELSGVAGIFTDGPLLVEEFTRGEYGARALFGYDPLFDRDEGDVIGRVGGPSIGLGYELGKAIWDDDMRASERGSVVRRSIPFAGLFYIRDVSRWAQKNAIDPLFER